MSLKHEPASRVVFYVGEDVSECVNACLLLSAYLVLIEAWPTEQVPLLLLYSRCRS